MFKQTCSKIKVGLYIKIGYGRVSSKDQNLDRQLKELEAYGLSNFSRKTIW